MARKPDEPAQNDPAPEEAPKRKRRRPSQAMSAEEEALAARYRRANAAGKGLGGTIGGIMHGIDANIFRDPASIQRIKRDRAAVVRTADGTVVGIELPPDKVIKEDLPKDAG
jgi:hypothetical protein